MPSELQSKVKPVTKVTDNKGGYTGGTPSATTDKVFLLSATEVWNDGDRDGTQYEYYKSKGVTTSNYSGASSSSNHWTRSLYYGYNTGFCCAYSTGDLRYEDAANASYVFPAWCF